MFCGIYYGCPVKWITLTKKGKYNCFVCPTVNIARKIKYALKDDIFWVHLTASSDVRLERMVKRDPTLNTDDIKIRVDRGDVPIDITGHDLLMNTSYKSASQILNGVNIYLHAFA